jgi:Anti-sigma-K factor rskA
MLKDNGERYEHEKFKRLCALAASSSLAPLELSELEEHLHCCEDCSEVLLQYRALSAFGMSSLADGYVESGGQTSWDESAVRQRVLKRVEEERLAVAEERRPARFRAWRDLAGRPAILGALAACLLVAVGFGAYRLGLLESRNIGAIPMSSGASAPDHNLQVLSAEKTFAEQALLEQGKKLAQLEVESTEKEKELLKLRAALASLEGRSSQLASTSAQTQAQSQTLSQQRDALNTQLQAMTQAYENQRAELTSLRAERDKTVLRTASLEAKVEELTATNNDQERRLKDADQYLSSDRDIRELMGARKLYIADVFDVDGSSRTQRPFGRVFYTQGKSLIFYAFDLDREPGVINASTFQVWGQREAPQGEQATPMNLGILYKDNETNRRWVMRFDEPKQLAEIDAVFVTVEPRGGSHKPTSKPFLYALLRNEANHP